MLARVICAPYGLGGGLKALKDAFAFLLGGGKPTDGNLIRNLVQHCAVRHLLLIGAALKAADQLNLVADFQVGGVARGTSPSDAGNIITY